MKGNGDIYKRINTGPNRYQCGCRWIRTPDVGDLLLQCPLHQAHTNMLVDQFEAKRRRVVDISKQPV